MARPKNVEERKRIMRCAQRLMLTHGYKKTSYQLIADTCGQSRALVQHYLPKKEMILTSFVTNLQHYFNEAIEEYRPIAYEDSVVYTLLLAQLDCAFLMDPRMRRAALEIMESRYLTELSIRIDCEFIFSQFQVPVEERAHITDCVTYAAGGSYELIYAKLMKHEMLDSAREAVRITDSLTVAVTNEMGTPGLPLDEILFTDEEMKTIFDGYLERLGYDPKDVVEDTRFIGEFDILHVS